METRASGAFSPVTDQDSFLGLFTRRPPLIKLGLNILVVRTHHLAEHSDLRGTSDISVSVLPVEAGKCQWSFSVSPPHLVA